MSTGSREPENYSIDDMMERLKQKSGSEDPEDGELVIRSDGSQAIRVRKRKRRSKQPIKERQQREQRVKFARLLSAFVVCLLLVAVVAGGVIYSNSRLFRDALVEKISAATGAQVEMRQFRMNPTGANADRLELAWPPGNPLESLNVRGLRADTSITSFFGGAFAGEELITAEATLTLRSPVDGGDILVGDASGAPAIDFKRIAVHRLHIHPGEDIGGLLRLRESEASFYPRIGSSGRPQMRLNRGDLRVPGLPDLRLDRALIEFGNGETELIVARLFHGDDDVGEMLLSGIMQGFEPTANASLVVQLSDFQIDGLLGERMGRLIRGRINSRGEDNVRELSFPTGDPAAGTLEVAFGSSLNSPLRFGGFNFMGELALLLNDPWFEQPLFEDNVSGVIVRQGGAVEIRDLLAESRNRMALRGNLRQEANGRLSGRLEVGLAGTMVAAAPTRRLDAVISEGSGGYRWIALEIGGTANAPTDNFMAQIDNPPPTTGGATFEDLTRPRD